MPFAVNDYVGTYLLIEQQGQGGMATVFKAYHAALDRYVALKVMHTAFTEDPTFLERFQREALVVAKLDHPHIVPIFDYSNEEGRPYLVMKYIEGVTLKEKLKKFRPTYREMLPIIEDVGSALTYAHELGIVHRDVKPSNVLISKEGKVYLTDFGLARMAQVSTTTLTSDQMIGTPQYISPEQATSSPNLDYRTDIYSFGVLIYEMVVGQVPFNADTPFAIIHDHIYTPLPLPSILNPSCPESIERVLLKALAKDPTDRYKDVNTMVRAFRGAIRQLEGTQVAESPIPAEKVAKQDSPAAYQSNLPVIENINPASKENAFQRSSKKFPPRQKQKFSISRKWLFIGGGILAGVLLLTLIGVIASNLRSTPPPNSPVATEPPREAVVPIATSGAGDSRAAQAAWLKAMLYWQHDDPDSMQALLLQSMEYAKMDPAILGQAEQFFYAYDAWLPTAFLISRTNQISGGNPADNPRMHEVLFKAADDINAYEFLAQNSNEPLFRVGAARSELKFGDPERTKRELEQISQDPSILANFPEFNLLKAEYLLKVGSKVEARTVIEPMLEDPALPDWVRALAKQIYPFTRY
jgi:serine/threonine protein kinase